MILNINLVSWTQVLLHIYPESKCWSLQTHWCGRKKTCFCMGKKNVRLYVFSTESECFAAWTFACMCPASGPSYCCSNNSSYLPVDFKIILRFCLATFLCNAYFLLQALLVSGQWQRRWVHERRALVQGKVCQGCTSNWWVWQALSLANFQWITVIQKSFSVCLLIM
jgi:hypothetical protein